MDEVEKKLPDGAIWATALVGLIEAYAYAGIISSGPWVLSILGILVIGFVYEWKKGALEWE